MKMKRTLACVLSLVLLFGLCMPGVLAATLGWDDAPNLKLVAEKIDETIKVSIILDSADAADLCGLEFDLKYPTDKLELTAEEKDNLVNTEFTFGDNRTYPTIETYDDVVSYAAARRANASFAGGTVFQEVNFNIKDGATESFEFKLSKLNIVQKSDIRE